MILSLSFFQCLDEIKSILQEIHFIHIKSIIFGILVIQTCYKIASLGTWTLKVIR